jgi:lysine 2,3-aminomutase
MSVGPIKTAADLVAAGLVPEAARGEIEKVSERFSISVSAPMLRLMDPGDADDPIAKQFVPDLRELFISPDELPDPIGDAAHSPLEGIVHRYPDRVLLKLVHICPVYCRFCFRREMLGAKGNETLSKEALAKALDYIAAHPQIWEVILSGGDPLVLSARRLGSLAAQLQNIPHVKILRLHSRIPVVEPDRITKALVRVLRDSGKTAYMILHANHPRELTSEARAACARLIDAGIPMLSQSVLLRGVNDDVESLSTLMRTFVEIGIKPYYIHQLDLAPGTSHFRVPIEEGQRLMRALRGNLSGLCQPSYMLDLPGGHGKSPIGPNYFAASAENSNYCVEDYQGGQHFYRSGPPQP